MKRKILIDGLETNSGLEENIAALLEHRGLKVISLKNQYDKIDFNKLNVEEQLIIYKRTLNEVTDVLFLRENNKYLESERYRKATDAKKKTWNMSELPFLLEKYAPTSKEEFYVTNF